MESESFALVQETLDRIPAGSLEQALDGVAGLSALDAAHLRRFAFGILVERLPLNAALRVKEALENQGIQLSLVPQSELPNSLPTKRVQKMIVLDTAIQLVESAGHTTTLNFADLKVLALGMVKRAESEVLYEDSIRTRYFSIGRSVIAIPVRHSVRVGTEFHDRILVEILTEDAAFELKLPDGADPISLVRQIALKAPNIERTAGCEAALQFGDVIPVYPSLHAFSNEIRWRLYRAKNGRPRLIAESE